MKPIFQLLVVVGFVVIGSLLLINIFMAAHALVFVFLMFTSEVPACFL